MGYVANTSVHGHVGTPSATQNSPLMLEYRPAFLPFSSQSLYSQQNLPSLLFHNLSLQPTKHLVFLNASEFIFTPSQITTLSCLSYLFTVCLYSQNTVLFDYIFTIYCYSPQKWYLPSYCLTISSQPIKWCPSSNPFAISLSIQNNMSSYLFVSPLQLTKWHQPSALWSLTAHNMVYIFLPLHHFFEVKSVENIDTSSHLFTICLSLQSIENIYTSSHLFKLMKPGKWHPSALIFVVFLQPTKWHL